VSPFLVLPHTTRRATSHRSFGGDGSPVLFPPKCEASSRFWRDHRVKRWQIQKGSLCAAAPRDRQTTPANCGGGPSGPPSLIVPRSGEDQPQNRNDFRNSLQQTIKESASSPSTGWYLQIDINYLL